MAKLRTASGLVDCKIFMRTAGGLVECNPMFLGDGGLVDGGDSVPLSAAAAPQGVYGASNGKPAVTNQTTVTATGGYPPYTYAWSEGADMVPTAPTAAVTAFRGFPGGGEEFNEQFTCTVTDARGQTVDTNQVNARISNFGGGGLA